MINFKQEELVGGFNRELDKEGLKQKIHELGKFISRNHTADRRL
jgi:hypothetical protein